MRYRGGTAGYRSGRAQILASGIAAPGFSEMLASAKASAGPETNTVRSCWDGPRYIVSWHRIVLQLVDANPVLASRRRPHNILDWCVAAKDQKAGVAQEIDGDQDEEHPNPKRLSIAQKMKGMMSR